MQPCIVKQPIHDANGKVWAYEILYSSGDSPSTRGHISDSEAAAMIQGLLLQCTTENFLENKIAFVTFTGNLLRHDMPRIFAAQSLVLQIDHDSLLLPDIMQLVRQYHEEGYKVALVGFDFNARYLSALNTVDYVKLSFHSARTDHRSAVEVLKGLGKTPIAYHVEDAQAYERAKELGITYMQGQYIASTLPGSMRSVDLLASNFFRLIVAVTREDPDFDEIEEIIARDVTLTYSLLKLVNSAFFALRTRVTSVHQALVVLGLSQLKQWIYLLSFNPDSQAPMEFIKTSLMRANFCEALCLCLDDMPISKSEAYLMGLFSTLGALLEIPLEQALREISLSDTVEKALLTGEGRCGTLYQLVLSYEKADWHAISEYAAQLGISQNLISQKYFECMDLVNESWRQITQAVI